MAKLENMTDKKFWNLTVLEFSHRDTKGVTYWLCKCDCGTECVRRIGDVKRGKLKSCGCKRYRNDGQFLKGKSPSNKIEFGKSAFNSLLKNYIEAAADRDIPFNLTATQFEALISKPCTYCGSLPRKWKKGKLTYGHIMANGVDRKNSSLGYTVENCTSCCKACNFAKRTQSEKEFANWIVGMSDWTRAFQQTVYAKAADLLASRMVGENF